MGFRLSACVPAPETEGNYDPSRLRFDGEKALETEIEFVTQFPNRASGLPNNVLAAAWLADHFTESGFDCVIDGRTVITVRFVISSFPSILIDRFLARFTDFRKDENPKGDSKW